MLIESYENRASVQNVLIMSRTANRLCPLVSFQYSCKTFWANARRRGCSGQDRDWQAQREEIRFRTLGFKRSEFLDEPREDGGRGQERAPENASSTDATRP